MEAATSRSVSLEWFDCVNMRSTRPFNQMYNKYHGEPLCMHSIEDMPKRSIPWTAPRKEKLIGSPRPIRSRVARIPGRRLTTDQVRWNVSSYSGAGRSSNAVLQRHHWQISTFQICLHKSKEIKMRFSKKHNIWEANSNSLLYSKESFAI